MRQKGRKINGADDEMWGFWACSFLNLAKIQKYDLNFKRFGAVFAFLSFLPVFGDLFVLGLGLSKYPFYKALFFITLGKAFRYGVLIYATLQMSA